MIQDMVSMATMVVTVCVLLISLLARGGNAAPATHYSMESRYDEGQPLSYINLHRQLSAMSSNVSITATPNLLGAHGETQEWVTVSFTKSPGAAPGDWVALFSPAKFDGSQCLQDLNLTNEGDAQPYICNAPIKFQYANSSSPDYVETGKGSLTFLVINQRYDYAFGFFSGDVTNPVLEGVSSTFTFKNPNAPVWPRLALGKEWDELTVTWTSGYNDADARPVVVYKWEEDKDWKLVVAVTLTYTKSDVCGPPASTLGWRDPGYTHTAFLKNLWPLSTYTYKVGHKLKNGQYVWGNVNTFKSSPYPGQDSLQRIIIFGDMGKHERDGSTEYSDGQKGALIVTDALVKDIANYDMVIHNGDIVYANGYLAQWEQYADQISNITKSVPWMLSSGNHERDWPDSGSFYITTDSGGECGAVMSTMYPAPTKNKDKYWYSADYGKFHFCVANSEFDWQKDSEQYKFLEECLASVDRQAQPWLIFLAHRVVGYSSGAEYQAIGTFGEPMGRDNLEELWQKYKVDVATYGHVHSYERTCPVYKDKCVGDETTNYSGQFNATIHIVAGTAGRNTEPFGPLNVTWSLVKDFTYEFGYLKFTSPDNENLKVDFIHAKDGSVADTFNINRKFMDIGGCDASLAPLCPVVTSADL
jgi:hypothetical protein